MKFQAKISYMETHCTLNTYSFRAEKEKRDLKMQTQILTKMGSGVHYNF